MNLVYQHAYEVIQQRLIATPLTPRGGPVAVNDDFAQALNTYLSTSGLLAQPLVDFNTQKHPVTQELSSPLRGLLLDYLFGKSPAIVTDAALQIAQALSVSMDKRSPCSLLMLCAYRDNNSSRMVLWAFPKEEPFHFVAKNGKAKVKVLQDAFSRSSSFKKAALFEGKNTKDDFWQGRVIDKQAQSGSATAADYWVTRFLDCRFSLTGKAGTQLLAKCLRKTHEDLKDTAERDQISTAIVGIHASKRAKWSMLTVADEFLTDSVRNTFLASVPQDCLKTKFELDKAEFSSKVNYRVFTTEDNVVLSAPFDTIGNSVELVAGKNRVIKYKGVVKSEKVRSQHG